jgi:hypothetical protein
MSNPISSGRFAEALAARCAARCAWLASWTGPTWTEDF